MFDLFRVLGWLLARLRISSVSCHSSAVAVFGVMDASISLMNFQNTNVIPGFCRFPIQILFASTWPIARNTTQILLPSKQCQTTTLSRVMTSTTKSGFTAASAISRRDITDPRLLGL